MSIHTSEAIELIHNRPGFAREVARQIGFTHIEKGSPPSFDEMKEAMKLASKSGIHRMVCALEERGHIVRIPHRARCIILKEAETQ